MDADLMREDGRKAFYLKDIREELYQLVNLSGDLIVPVQVLFDMEHAAAGGGDDVIEVREVVDEIPVTSFRQMTIAGIGHGLTAARLSGRVRDFASQLLQQLQGSDGCAGIELVDITGYEESDIHMSPN